MILLINLSILWPPARSILGALADVDPLCAAGQAVDAADDLRLPGAVRGDPAAGVRAHQDGRLLKRARRKPAPDVIRGGRRRAVRGHAPNPGCAPASRGPKYLAPTAI